MTQRAYVGMIIYPINGRAQGITPIGHFCFHRNEIITAVYHELLDQEPDFAEAGVELLKTHDVVRVGRIIVQILSYPRDIELVGAEPLSILPRSPRSRCSQLPPPSLIQRLRHFFLRKN